MAFKKTFKRKGPSRTKAPFRRLHKKNTGRTGPTRVMIPMARQLHQPLPDRLFTWLTGNNSGYLSATSSPYTTFGIGLNTLQFPFNTTANGGTNVMPHVIQTADAWNPTGFDNLLYNGNTSTGLYKNYRVWGAKVSVTVLPEALADTCQVVMAPQVSGNSLYADSVIGIMTAAQGPDSINKVVQAGAPVKQNSLKKYYRIYDLLGIPKKEYAANVRNTYGYDGETPTQQAWLYIGARAFNQSNFTFAVGMEVTVEYFVEFFTRIDSALLQT